MDAPTTIPDTTIWTHSSGVHLLLKLCYSKGDTVLQRWLDSEFCNQAIYYLSFKVVQQLLLPTTLPTSGRTAFHCSKMTISSTWQWCFCIQTQTERNVFSWAFSFEGCKLSKKEVIILVGREEWRNRWIPFKPLRIGQSLQKQVHFSKHLSPRCKNGKYFTQTF